MMLGLSSCNPGIFIERLEASEEEYILPFRGGTAEVELSHGDWEIDRIAVNNIDVDAVAGEDGAMRYESGFISFSLTRTSGRMLVFALERSTDPDAVEADVHISNDFQSLRIPVIIEACRGYSFDRIEYGTVTDRVEAYEEVRMETIPAEREVSVFDERFGRRICFPATSVSSGDIPEAMWMEELLKYVGGTFDVPIPVPFPEEGVVPECKGHIGFSYKEGFMSLEYPSEKVTLPEGGNTIHMYWGFVEYRVPYTIWFRHPEGEALSFSGELVSKAYDGRWRVEP